MADEASKIAYGEIRAWAIKSLRDFSPPAGLADAKASIFAVSKRNSAAKNVASKDGSKASQPGDKAAWKNIVEAKGGKDKSNGAKYFCVGDQKCVIVQKCSYWNENKIAQKKRDKPLSPVATVKVGGNSLYFYKDEFMGWCNKDEFLGKTQKKVKDKDEAKKSDALKKLRFSGKLSGSQRLLNGANKTTFKSGKSFGDISFDGSVDGGDRSIKKVTGKVLLPWDSLAREIFEKLGLLPTSGFDIQIDCGVTFGLVAYKNLGQEYLTKLVPTCSVVFNTPVAKYLSMTVDAAVDVSLQKSSTVPKGTVTFSYQLVSPIQKDKGKVVLKIAGDSVSG